MASDCIRHQARVREEWREKYDPENKLSADELREKVRKEFIEQVSATDDY